MVHSRRSGAHKGRGAVSNSGGRFEREDREVFDDGWGSADEEPAAPETTLHPDPARRIITRNNSPDIPFEASINPYKGCEHGCPYCLEARTPVLMVDGSHKPIRDLRTGDRIIGTRRQGWYRHYVATEVKAHWASIRRGYRLTLADGTTLIASGDHRFLTERGWKHLTPPSVGNRQRPYLTGNNKLMGTGTFENPPLDCSSYRRGYLCGMLRDDGHLGHYRYARPGLRTGNVFRFRLALKDNEALARSQAYLADFAVGTRRSAFQQAAGDNHAMEAIRASSRYAFDTIASLIEWPARPSRLWCRGFLAGLFDAEGHYRDGILRLRNSDPVILSTTATCLDTLGFAYRTENSPRATGKPVTVIRLLGGLSEHLRFFHTTNPAIGRKRTPAGQALKHNADLAVAHIEDLGRSFRMYDITTGTGDFIANGVVSHNCFARPTHSYLDLSPGLDFETRIFFKENAADKLEAELRKPGYRPSPISLGINTDAYQPAERELKVTRSLLEVLWAYRHPVTLLTKSSLITRDLDLIAPMAEYNLVSCAISVTTLDPATKRCLEPRTASPAARLSTVAALAEAGAPTSVMAAPVIPAITDHELEAILDAAAERGARGAGYVLLRLPWEVKDVFREWLATHYPDRAEHVMSLVQQSRGGRDYDAAWGQRQTGTGQFAELIAQRFRLACRRFGLNRDARPALDCTRFAPPVRSGDQMGLF